MKMSDDNKSALIATNELHRKLDSLEKRAARLSEQYDTLIARADFLESATTTYMSRIAQEQRVATIVELLMRRDNRSAILLDYVWIFFESVLRKVQNVGVSVSNLSELWSGLQEKNTRTHDVFNATIEKLGFTCSEHRALLQVFEVVHDKQLSTQANKCPTEEIMRRQQKESLEHDVNDSKVASVFLYLQIQDELQSSVRACLRRVVAVAHSGLMGAEDQETTLHIGSLTAPGIVSRFLTGSKADKSASVPAKSISAIKSSDLQLESPADVRNTKSDQGCSILDSSPTTDLCVMSDGIQNLTLCTANDSGVGRDGENVSTLVYSDSSMTEDAPRMQIE